MFVHAKFHTYSTYFVFVKKLPLFVPLQVCRVAYELMQTHSVDASNSYYSLDDVYYYGGQQAHDVVAIVENKQLLKFSVGDRLGIAGNEKNGFSVGQHRDTYKRGPYPSYKVEEFVRTANFPTYSELD